MNIGERKFTVILEFRVERSLPMTLELAEVVVPSGVMV